MLRDPENVQIINRLKKEESDDEIFERMSNENDSAKFPENGTSTTDSEGVKWNHILLNDEWTPLKKFDRWLVIDPLRPIEF